MRERLREWWTNLRAAEAKITVPLTPAYGRRIVASDHRMIARYLRHLAHRIGEHQTLSADELHRLATEFDSLAAEIENRNERTGSDA